ncbi:MAG: 4Fe-4S dicluster domain-containing protein [Desulfobacteraceae bacterium]|nr:MAG: 4Fe-4S dicluster domain-containing protein [Desulfobacteraceae bacterium]
MEREFYKISGRENGQRLSSRILEEKIQQAVAAGHRALLIEACGQHGIGGRLWKAGAEPVYVKIEGNTGQRTGSLGYPNTLIEIMGPASDDAGWLNAGAHIVVHGHAGNGLANAMAQGKIFVGGNTGARAMTMTKRNPRFAHPEVWVLGSVGDYFGEFMAGGIAVICGVDGQDPENVLGYRPLVGMVGGQVFFRGPHKGYSTSDTRLSVISDDQWNWFTENLKNFLDHIHRPELLESLSVRSDWNLLVTRTIREKAGVRQRSMSSFRKDVWDKELGNGGLIGDLTHLDRRPIPLVPTGDLRRFVPEWANQKYLSPCEASCPSGIPVQERWRLIREGRLDEAVDLALAYTPFPATVCGYLCPNPCMQACTRQINLMKPIDTTQLGKASINASVPDLPPMSGKRIGVIGGGPAGISIAWQLRQQGHEAVIHDRAGLLGGKISSVIPETRIPKDVLTAELDRVRKVIPQVNLTQNLDRNAFGNLKNAFDFLVIATGAQKPRTLPVPGNERSIPAADFLEKAKTGAINPGKRLVVIGAGNVGCDVATEAHRLGARELTLIDVQEPAAFGKERKEAEEAGAVFRWPCFTKEITAEGVVLDSGELIPADTVVVSIGDMPDLDFLPENIDREHGFVAVNESFQTSDPTVFAIGDTVRPGLLTDAIGAGRKAARAIADIIDGHRPLTPQGTSTGSRSGQQMIDRNRVSLEYFDPRITEFKDTKSCGSQCASCGACRDCGICVAMCPQAAISREQKEGTTYEYRVDADKCIGCGFCAGACPCGVWEMTANRPMEG